MTPEEFRAAAHELVDWIADRRASVEQRPVRPTVEPGDIVAGLPPTPPTEPVGAEAVLGDLDTIVAPGITEVQHPMHFGWFPSNASLSSVLGDIASAGLGSLGISWESSPALTEVEEVVVDWLRQLCGLGDEWRGVIQDTASTACLVAMLAARERATDHAQAGRGLVGFGRSLTVYTTAEAHSSVRKGALLAGFAADDIKVIDVDPWTRDMRADLLAETMEADAAAGAVPAIVVASVGSTGTTAMDPVPAIVEAAAAHGAWVHVDAAMAGAAMVLPEQRHLFAGVDSADSISWNPHKWFGTILDCSLMYLRDPDHLIRVMSTNPSYLRSTAGGEATQYRDWGIPLGRRFRSLKLWYQLRIDGIESVQVRLRRDLDNAKWFAAQIEALDGWSVVAPVRLQTVCVRHDRVPADDWVREINLSGDAFLSPSLLDGEWMARVSIGVEATERHHLQRLLTLMQSAVHPPHQRNLKASGHKVSTELQISSGDEPGEGREPGAADSAQLLDVDSPNVAITRAEWVEGNLHLRVAVRQPDPNRRTSFRIVGAEPRLWDVHAPDHTTVDVRLSGIHITMPMVDAEIELYRGSY